MIRCYGFSNGRRAIHGERTQAGKAARSAERKRHCCAASANAAARLIKTNCGAFRSIVESMQRPYSKFVRYPNGMSIGTARRLKALTASLNDESRVGLRCR